MLAVLRRKLQEKALSAPLYEADMSEFTLPDRFDLVIIPFNSFAEITDPALQANALNAIRSHLSEKGRFICTLHNPAIRLKNVDGQDYFRGRYPMPNDSGTLFLSSLENYNPNTKIVSGFQFYEIYSPNGEMQIKRFVELSFFLHSKESFEELVSSNGFKVTALYGDYDYTEFSAETSPYMIWILEQ